MKRTCPFCKSTLHGNDIFFCTSCGNILPDNVQLKEFSLRNVRSIDGVQNYPTSSFKFLKNIFKKASNVLDSKTLLVGIGVGVLIATCFYLLVRFTLFSSNNSNETKVMEVNKRSDNDNLASNPSIVNLNINLSSGTFGQFKVSNLVPGDVDLYMETNDFSSFEPYFNFLGGEVFTLYENIKESVKQFYCAFLSTKDGKQYWSFLVFPSKEDINTGGYSGLATKRINDVLVISTSDLMIEEIESSISGTQKSLSLNPSYVLIKNSLPVEGKMFLMALNNDKKSEALNVLDKTTSEELKLIISSFKELDSNFIVIK
ncbi:TFIIB-type zinc ribbon-containing protein [candidate division WWE3 bacterium]|uniref:TFIIB-type zinc ribbon-containing protein n=1 Tax=candidate division WWE3 bacterium TaxID=2053526 RepID=A0A7X9E6J6_UNCKA|nr:TFIIB-type zinc ribbon-containing protein [candidate division WWE3 bacterium]